tara:strand:- start:52 stop:273 length:222 start_codon:yes stop_codon:yes gene_type:complete
MAATIAWATGYDKGDRVKEVSRLGSQMSEGRAATWKTRAIAHIHADGSGYVEVRDIDKSKAIHTFEFGPESER